MRRAGNIAGLVNALRWKANLGVDQGRFDERDRDGDRSGAARRLTRAPPQKRLTMLANHTLAATRISARREGRWSQPGGRTNLRARLTAIA